MTNDNQTFEMALGYRLGYLSVIGCGLFLKQGSHATAMTVLRNIHLHKISKFQIS